MSAGNVRWTGHWVGLCAALAAVGLGYAQCGGDDDDREVGRSCESADACYQLEDRDDIAGKIQCLDRVKEGYCTHTCETDEDCCSVEGECEPGVRQVCGPFESTGLRLCFISCEASDINDENADNYCDELASRDFGCRSTGGGSANRKVCVPSGDGDDDGLDDD